VKVGLSFSLCIRDVICQEVPESDILVITTGTDFDPHNDQQWSQIYAGYQRVWNTGHGESEYRYLSTRLYDLGRIHQPRQFDRHNRRNWSTVFGYHWLDLMVTQPELQKNAAALDLWNRFQVVARLSDIHIDPALDS
jgi:hypothetical protein